MGRKKTFILSNLKSFALSQETPSETAANLSGNGRKPKSSAKIHSTFGVGLLVSWPQGTSNIDSNIPGGRQNKTKL